MTGEQTEKQQESPAAAGDGDAQAGEREEGEGDRFEAMEDSGCEEHEVK